MQYTLGDFQVQLTPTPDPLEDINDILGLAIEQVMDTTFQALFGGSFEYMYVANVKQVDLLMVPFGDRTRHRHRERRILQSVFVGSTVVVFTGAVVAFDTDPFQDVRAIIKTTLEEDLRAALVQNGGSWALIQEVVFKDLEPLPTLSPSMAPTVLTITASPTAAPVVSPTLVPTVIPSLAPIATVSPTTTTVTALPSVLPTTAPVLTFTTVQPSSHPTAMKLMPHLGTPSGIEEGQQVQVQTARASKGNDSETQEIVGGFFGVAFFLVAVVMFVRLSRQKGEQLEDMVIAMNQAEQHQQQRNGPTVPVPCRSGDNTNYNDSENESQMAQYATGDLLDSISVASEWTMASSKIKNYTDDSTAARLGGEEPSSVASLLSSYPQIPSSRVAALGYASSETFERDRRVTLQKDLLQSEWTSLPPPGTMSGVDSAFVMMRKPSPPSPHIRVTGSSSSVSRDEESNSSGKTGSGRGSGNQGEEIYLIPPPGSGSSRSGTDATRARLV